MYTHNNPPEIKSDSYFYIYSTQNIATRKFNKILAEWPLFYNCPNCVPPFGDWILNPNFVSDVQLWKRLCMLISALVSGVAGIVHCLPLFAVKVTLPRGVSLLYDGTYFMLELNDV